MSKRKVIHGAVMAECFHPGFVGLDADLLMDQEPRTGQVAIVVMMADAYAALTAEWDRYREFVEWLYIATADGTLNLDTPAILDGLQCRSAEVLGEERAEELLNALNREDRDFPERLLDLKEHYYALQPESEE